MRTALAGVQGAGRNSSGHGTAAVGLHPAGDGSSRFRFIQRQAVLVVGAPAACFLPQARPQLRTRSCWSSGELIDITHVYDGDRALPDGEHSNR